MVDLFSDPSFDLLPARRHSPPRETTGSDGPAMRTAFADHNAVAAAAVSPAPGMDAAPLGSGAASSGTAADTASVGSSATAAELAIPGLTALTVAARVGPSNRVKEAEKIFHNRAIFALRRVAGGHAMASVRGSRYPDFYTVQVRSANAADPQVDCTCPDFAQRGALCKHGAAVLLALVPGSGYTTGSSGINGSLPNVKREEVNIKEERGHPQSAEERLSATGSTLRVKEEDHSKVKDEVCAVTPPPLPPPVESPPHWLQNGEGLQTPAPRKPSEDFLLQPTPEASVQVSQDSAARPLKRRKMPASFAKALEAPAAPGGRARSSGEAPMVIDWPDAGPGPDGASATDAGQGGPKRARQSPKRRTGSESAAGARPPSAYQLYLRATKTFGTSEGQVKWRDLSPEEKRPYEEQAHDARLKFEADAPQRSAAAIGMEERVMPARPFGLTSSQPAAVSAPVQATLPPQPSPTEEATTWSCPSCTFLNSALIPACEICGALRRVNTAPPEASSSSSHAPTAPPAAVINAAPAAPARSAAASSSTAVPETVTAAASSSAPAAAAPTPASKRPWLSENGLKSQLDALMFDDSPEPLEASSQPAKPSTLPAVAPILATRRTRCRYGEKCYQKNPKHKMDFCHPGDADWSHDAGRTASASSTEAAHASQPHSSQAPLSVSAALRVAAAFEGPQTDKAAPRDTAPPTELGQAKRAEEFRPSASAASTVQPTPATATASSTPAPLWQALSAATCAVSASASASSSRPVTTPQRSPPRQPTALQSAAPAERPAAGAAPVVTAGEPPLVSITTPAAPAAPVEGHGRPVVSFFDRLAELD